MGLLESYERDEDIMSDPTNLQPRWHIVRAQVFLFIKGMLTRMTLGTRGLLIDADKVLLIRHTYVRGWQMPGGGVDPGESAEAGFRREVLEETGYKVTGPARLFGFYHNVQATNRDHVVLYVTESFEKSFERTPDREIAEIGWFSWKNLPEDTTPSTRKRIEEVFGKAEADELW